MRVIKKNTDVPENRLLAWIFKSYFAFILNDHWLFSNIWE